MKRSVLDANVLFSAVLRDMFVQLALDGAFQAFWTDEIHNEWTRNVLLKRNATPAQLQRTRYLMELHLPDARVENYQSLIETLALPDADDRHVLAAAISARAESIVTFNLADFPAATLRVYGVKAVHPDLFLLKLLDENAAKVVDSLRKQRQRLRDPPQSVAEFLATLERQNLPAFTAKLRQLEAEI